MITRSLILAFAVLAFVSCSAAPSTLIARTGLSAHQLAAGPVQHVVILTMENRSFDEMFGMYPGVNGLNNRTTGCNPDPKTGTCLPPYHDTSLVNHGGPHGILGEAIDLDNGKLDGFVRSAEMPTRKSYNPFP